MILLNVNAVRFGMMKNLDRSALFSKGFVELLSLRNGFSQEKKTIANLKYSNPNFTKIQCTRCSKTCKNRQNQYIIYCCQGENTKFTRNHLCWGLFIMKLPERP